MRIISNNLNGLILANRTYVTNQICQTFLHSMSKYQLVLFTGGYWDVTDYTLLCSFRCFVQRFWDL